MRKLLFALFMLVAMAIMPFGAIAVDLAGPFMELGMRAAKGSLGLPLESIPIVKPVPGVGIHGDCKVLNNFDVMREASLIDSFVHLASVMANTQQTAARAIISQTSVMQAYLGMETKGEIDVEGRLAGETMKARARTQAVGRMMDIVNTCEGSVGKAFENAMDDATWVKATMAADDRNVGMGISSSSAETWALLGNMARQLDAHGDFSFFPSSGTLDETGVQDMTFARNILLSSIKNPRPNLDKMDDLTKSKYLTSEMNAANWRVLLGEGLRQWQVSRMPLIDFGEVQMWLGAFRTPPVFKTTTQKAQEDASPIQEQTTAGSENQQEKPAFNGLRKYSCPYASTAPVGVPNPLKIASLNENGAIPNINQLAEKYAYKYDLNVDLFKAMIGQESRGRNLAKNNDRGGDGDLGPCQTSWAAADHRRCPNVPRLPKEWQGVSARLVPQEVKDKLNEALKNPEINVECGAKELRACLDENNQDYLNALICYNGGTARPKDYKAGKWRSETTYCHVLNIFGVNMENALAGIEFRLPGARTGGGGSVYASSANPSEPIQLESGMMPVKNAYKNGQPLTTAEFHKIAETEATLGIGDKISLSTFLDLVGQRAISQDYMARISSIGNSADEMDDESNDALGALYGEMLRLMAWKFILMTDMRKTYEINNLLKSLKVLATYDKLNKTTDSIVK